MRPTGPSLQGDVSATSARCGTAGRLTAGPLAAKASAAETYKRRDATTTPRPASAVESSISTAEAVETNNSPLGEVCFRSRAYSTLVDGKPRGEHVFIFYIYGGSEEFPQVEASPQPMPCGSEPASAGLPPLAICPPMLKEYRWRAKGCYPF
jgi:hypothetical protein